jgi:hypothetical protein
LKDKTIHNPYHINHYLTSETAFYSGIPIYDWENDEYEKKLLSTLINYTTSAEWGWSSKLPLNPTFNEEEE